MEATTKGNTSMTKNQDKENFTGQMVKFMMAGGTTVDNMARVS